MTIITTIVGVILTALLGYWAGLHRDRRSVDLERERERRNDVQSAAMDIIIGSRDKVAALMAQQATEPYYELSKRHAEQRGEPARTSGIREADSAQADQRLKNAEQGANAQRMINRAIVTFRIIAPDLVTDAQQLRDYADEVTDTVPLAERYDHLDRRSDGFAQAVQMHLSRNK